MQKKFFALTLAIGAMAFSMTSCDDDNNPGSGSETGKVNPINVFTQGLPTQVGDYVIVKGANGLVSKVIDGDDVTTFNYTPAPSRAGISIPSDYDMSMNTPWGEDENGVDLYFKLNSQGFVVYAYEVDEEPDGIATPEWWFKYDNAGRLIELKRTEGDNEVTVINYNTEGDITSVKVSDDKAPDGKMSCTIAYTDDSHSTPIANKSGIMLYDASFRIDMDEMAPAYYAGLLGKGTAHLPLKADEINQSKEGESRDYYTFEWTFNANNMPIKFVSTVTSYYPGTDPSTYTEDPIKIKW